MHKKELAKRKITIDSDVRIIILLSDFPEDQNRINVKISEAVLFKFADILKFRDTAAMKACWSVKRNCMILRTCLMNMNEI